MKSQMSSFDLTQEIPGIKKLPNFKDFLITISWNGGPMALMLKTSKMDGGVQIDEEHVSLKDKIFVLSQYGRLIKTIDVSIQNLSTTNCCVYCSWIILIIKRELGLLSTFLEMKIFTWSQVRRSFSFLIPGQLPSLKSFDLDTLLMTLNHLPFPRC